MKDCSTGFSDIYGLEKYTANRVASTLEFGAVEWMRSSKCILRTSLVSLHVDHVRKIPYDLYSNE